MGACVSVQVGACDIFDKFIKFKNNSYFKIFLKS